MMSKKRILYVNWKPFYDNCDTNWSIGQSYLSFKIFYRNQLGYLISNVITICHCVFVNYTPKKDTIKNVLLIVSFSENWSDN